MSLVKFKNPFKKTATRIESIDNPFEDYYIIKLRMEYGLKWIPGEFGIFRLPGKSVNGKKWRALSIASVPKEGFILLGTRTGKKVSSFKNNLIHMERGEIITFNGPLGQFKLRDESSPVVLFASGVGVTPIRSILKSLENNSKREVEIVYASGSYYLFEDEIAGIAKNNSKIALHKTKSVEETQLKLDELAKKYQNTAFYYNSGAPSVLKSIRSEYKRSGIKNNRIIDDSFLGY